MKKVLMLLSVFGAVACEDAPEAVCDEPCEEEVIVDCMESHIEVQVYGSDGLSVGHHIEIEKDGVVLLDTDCESWGFCGLWSVGAGDYHITVTYGGQTMTDIITLDEDNFYEHDHSHPEFASCPDYYAEQVNFTFESDA